MREMSGQAFNANSKLTNYHAAEPDIEYGQSDAFKWLVNEISS